MVKRRRVFEQGRRAAQDARNQREDDARERWAKGRADVQVDIAEPLALAKAAGLSDLVLNKTSWTDLHEAINQTKWPEAFAIHRTASAQQWEAMCLTQAPADSLQPKAIPLHLLAHRKADCSAAFIDSVVEGSRAGWQWRNSRGGRRCLRPAWAVSLC